MNYCTLFLLSCFLLTCIVPGLTETKTELIQKYLKEVVDHPNYDKRVPPDGKEGPGTAVDVYVSMYLLDISTLNEQTMDFEAQLYFRQHWVDSRLKYDLEGVQKIVLTNVDTVWTPDLFFNNEKEGSINKITQPNIYFGISPNGTILYSTKVYEKFACKMDLRNFPHDRQACKITVESYGFALDSVILQWKSGGNAVSSTNSITAFNFDLFDVTYTRFLAELNVGTFSALEATLIFERNVGYFTARMYAPFVFFVILSWISFWISAEERSIRLVFLLVTMYLMLATATELDRWIPYTPYSKASDVWIGCCEGMVFASFLEFIFVSIYFKREQKEESSWGNIEMTPTLDNEGEEKDWRSNSFKTLVKKLNIARRGRSGGGTCTTNPVDRISRFAFPITFIVFIIIYCSVYVVSSGSIDPSA